MTKNSQMLKGILEGCTLKVIKDHRTYGYEIVTKLNEFGFEGMTEGTVYPMLTRMEKNGFLETIMMDSPRGPKRKYYFLSNKGRRELKKFEAEWEELQAAVTAVLEYKKNK